MIGAGAILTQVVQDMELIIAFDSHRFLKTDANRGPTGRECTAVLHAVAHFGRYLARGDTYRLRHQVLGPDLTLPE